MKSKVRLEGYALHRGVPTAVTLARSDGPIAFERDGLRATLADLSVRRSDAGVAVTDGQGFDLDLVEHLLAALGGLGIDGGVTAFAEGPELPILDGGARRFADALLELDVVRSERAVRAGESSRPPGARGLTVMRAAELRDDDSIYTFDVADEPSLEVETVFDHPAIGTQSAAWDGSREAFLSAIATARTFGFQSDLAALVRSGRAELAIRQEDAAARAFADAVIVFDAEGPALLGASRPPSQNELARHKLLDLIGDLAFYGGPPAGRTFARRPGHTASHRIIREALSLGILSRR